MRLRARRWCAAFLLLLPGVTARAAAQITEPPTWYARMYGIEDGLPSSQVLAITQDHDGYLWLGTTLGLVRFDGLQFVLWDGHGDPAFPVNDVRTLLTARDGSVWIGWAGIGGVSRMSNGRVVHYTDKDGLPRGLVTTITELRDGSVVMGAQGEGGIARFRANRWERFDVGLPPRASVFELHEDRRGTLWVGTSAGIFRRASDGEAFEPIAPDVVRSFTEDAAGDLWIPDPHHAFKRLFSRSGVSAERRTETKRSGVGVCVFHDRRGNMWVGTRSGLVVVRAQEGSEGGRLQIDEQQEVANEVVLTIFEDRESNIWVGTQSGLVRLFEHDVSIITHAEGLADNTVGAVAAASDGTVWIGTADGLHRFSSRDGHLEGTRYAVPGVRITALHADMDGRLWIGTEEGVRVLDNQRVVPPRMSESAPVGRVTVIASDAQRRLWLCVPSLVRWDGRTLTTFEHDDRIRTGSCTSAYTDRAGRVWIGFIDGTLAVYDQDRFRTFGKGDGLTGDPVVAIHGDDAGVLWFATHSGVSRLKNGVITTITRQHGLPGRDVVALTDDARGHLWFALSASIVKLDQGEFDAVAADPTHLIQYSVFDASNGLSSAPTWLGYPTSARGGDGRLWFQTVKGVATIDPERLFTARPSAAVQLERMIADGRTYVPATDVRLEPRTSNLEIQYTAVSLSAVSKVSFSYKLEGFDAQWIDAGARRQAFYTALPPGDYRFLARARMGGAPRSSAEWRFSVQPAFYQTRWFWALSVVSAGFVVWGAFRFRVRAVRHEISLVAAERARIGREIHDTLLQNMAAIALQLERAVRRLDREPQDGKEDLRRVRRRVEQHIQEARDTIWELRSLQAQTRVLPEALRAFGEQLTANSAIRLELDIRGEPRQYSPELEQELLRIGQEAIRNAVRHARPAAIRVVVTYEPDSVRLTVSDDGRGFRPDEPPAPGEQWGLLGMKERAEKAGGRFTIVSDPERGTEVDVVIDRP